MTFDSLDYRPMAPAAGTFAFLGAVSLPGTPEKIESFRQLPVGWHYGEGGPVDDAVIRRACDLLSFLQMIGLMRTDAFAGAGGEILLAAYHRDHYVGVIVEPDGSFALSHEVGDREIRDRERMSLVELKSELLEVKRGIWSSSDSFISRTSTTYGADSMISASKTSEALSQWSIGNVWMLPVSRSALMLEGTTQP